MIDDRRYCPLCDRSMEARHCPEHGVPTVPALSTGAHVVRPGVVIGERFIVERPLGEGGMGSVWVALQQGVQRRVAVKLLAAGMVGRPDALRRFYGEARALSRLSHPHIIEVIDFGVDGPLRLSFLVMALIDGQPLSRLLADQGALAERRALGLIEQLARALAEPHHAGIVHRDLKPANVIVRTTADGREHATLLDFPGEERQSRAGVRSTSPSSTPDSATGCPPSPLASPSGSAPPVPCSSRRPCEGSPTRSAARSYGRRRPGSPRCGWRRQAPNAAARVVQAAKRGARVSRIRLEAGQFFLDRPYAQAAEGEEEAPPQAAATSSHHKQPPQAAATSSRHKQTWTAPWREV